MNNDNNNNNIEKTSVIEIPDEGVTSSVVQNQELNNNIYSNMNSNLQREEPVNNMAINNANINNISEVVSTNENNDVVTENSVSNNPVLPNAINENNNNNIIYEKDKKVWPFILIFIVLLIGGLFSYYYFVLTKPSNIINKIFTIEYKNVEKALKSSNSNAFDLKSFILDSNISFTSEDKELSEVSGLNAKLNIGYDFENKNNNIIDANITLGENTLVNMAATLSDGKTYLDLKDGFDKIIYTESEENFDGLDKIEIDKKELDDNINDVLYIVEKLKDSLLKNISEEKLSKKMMLKDIDGKKVPVNEVTYVIDYPEYKKLHNAVYDSIINDDKALSIYSKFENVSVSEVKKELQEERDEISELDFDSTITVLIDINVFTNKLVSLNAKNDSSEVNYREQNNEANIEFKSNEDGTISATIDKKENKIFIEAKFLEDEEVNKFAITLKVDEISERSYKTTVSFVAFNPKEISKEMFNLTGEFKLILNENVKSLDTENAVNVESLSQKEAEQVNNALSTPAALIQEMGEM